MSRLRKSVILSALLISVAPLTPAQAHRQWLLPSATNIEGEAPYVTFDAAVSEGLFDFDYLPIKLDGLTITGPDGLSVAPENNTTGKRRSSFDVKLAKPGTYRASIASQSVMANYTLNGEAKRWRGTEAELATAIPAGATEVRTSRMETRIETFVTAGESNSAALAPIGKGFELVALSNPTAFELGVQARFRALIDGKPVAGLDVTFVPGGGRFRPDTKDMSVKTDAAGVAAITWPMAGMYWVGASWPAREAAPANALPGNAATPAAAGAPPLAPIPAPIPAPPRRLTYVVTVEVAPF